MRSAHIVFSSHEQPIVLWLFLYRKYWQSILAENKIALDIHFKMIQNELATRSVFYNSIIETIWCVYMGAELTNKFLYLMLNSFISTKSEPKKWSKKS